MRQYFSKMVKASVIVHAKQEYPKESCGFVIDGQYWPQKNTADNPETDFRIDPKKYIEHSKHGTIEAVVHSHPNRKPMIGASKADMHGQLESNLPWGIVFINKNLFCEVFWWGNQLERQDLLQRPFVHGVYDCYSLVKDWFKIERDIDLPEVPREFGWWDKGEEVVMDGLSAAGFEVVYDDFKYGDGLVAKVQSKVINHTGIYIGDGLVLHHLARQVSCREPLYPYRKHIIHKVRHRSMR